MNLVHKLSESFRWLWRWKRLPPLEWLEAEKLLQEKRYSEAESKFRKGISKHPKHPVQFNARLSLAKCFYVLGKHKEALSELRSLTIQNPHHRNAQTQLAEVQISLCRSRDALDTVQRTISLSGSDPHLAALFLIAALDAGITGSVLRQAQLTAGQETRNGAGSKLLAVALAKNEFRKGNVIRAKAAIARLCTRENPFLDALIAMGEILLKEDNTLGSRSFLRRALRLSPNDPRVHSLIAESYLVESPGYSPAFALQMATSACRNSLWESPRAMHILAEAYYQSGEKTDALLVAKKAREVGNRIAQISERAAANTLPL